ncbi:MAG: acetolactate synthase small subunit [Oscillospiraceae bacterium]|nr:acetolactate synthase small subunit [Oscillospiraceae bacterium]
MNSFTIAILVKNKFGVLNRVTSMFRRRQFNIASLNVSETETDEYSRITVISAGDERTKDQLIDQLYKLPDVVSIKELDELTSISREVLLIKVENNPETRRDVLDAAVAFGAETVDYSKASIIFQLTSKRKKIDEFVELMREYNIIEICRTGVGTLERGGDTLRQAINL